jgi:hypothetical protein
MKPPTTAGLDLHCHHAVWGSPGSYANAAYPTMTDKKMQRGEWSAVTQSEVQSEGDHER